MLLIDTYNVLHVTGVLPPDLAGMDLPDLVKLIGRSRYNARPATLVCDGHGGRSAGARMGDVHVLFSGPTREADDLIETLIDRYAHGRTLTVISSDRRLRKAARRRGADWLSSEAFLRLLIQDHRRRADPGPPVYGTEIPLNKWSVEAWVAEFGVQTWAPSTTDVPKRPATPAPPPPAPTTPPAPSPHPRRMGRPTAPNPASPDDPASPGDPQAPPDLDPALGAALQEWRGRLRLDDLEMNRWIDGVHLNPDRTP